LWKNFYPLWKIVFRIFAKFTVAITYEKGGMDLRGMPSWNSTKSAIEGHRRARMSLEGKGGINLIKTRYRT